MPKISAPSVEKHVQQQLNKLLRKAGQLFREKGYLATDMGDIANAMGLKRNSLYRYYKSKDHILLDCIRREIEPHIEKEKALAEEIKDPVQLLDRLIELQIDFATSADHASMNLMEEIRKASPDLAREIANLHDTFQFELRSAIKRILEGSGRESELVTAMIIGMVQSSSLYALSSKNKAKAKKELRNSVHLILDRKG